MDGVQWSHTQKNIFLEKTTRRAGCVIISFLELCVTVSFDMQTVAVFTTVFH